MKRHWYTIKFMYTNYTEEVASCERTIGIIDQVDILNHRLLKQTLSDEFITLLRDRKLLCNGELSVSVVTYLGKFNDKRITFREIFEKVFDRFFIDYFISLLNGENVNEFRKY